ncbi:MAG: glycosyltransferase, partial [Verrucomicrobia bacterium]|nr:glycosyltransferase [Verrucomicrobiota bacterium]
MRASIIVCTRDRADSIVETFEALAALEPAGTEIVVVDTSKGKEKEKTFQLAKRFGARYVHEPRSGLSLARNTGIANATGDIIAFTDDDCIPAPDWLAHKVRVLSAPTVWGCTGRVVQHSSAGACDLFNEVAGQDLGPERREFTRQNLEFGLGMFFSNVAKIFAKHMKSRAPGPWSIGHGSSMAFRREVFDRVGKFDERLGGGAPLKSCDDTEMFYRVLKSGHRIIYEPAAVVRHKHGLDNQDVYKTRYGYSFGGAAFMWEYKHDPLMFVMFWGRLVQL